MVLFTDSQLKLFYSLFTLFDGVEGCCHGFLDMLYCLQEVETEQYYTLFLETLKERGYDGYFCPKSRAKLVSEQERKHVDGCAVFFKTEKCVSEMLL